ncbi:hypothetical protein, partial [Serratia entomophila]
GRLLLVRGVVVPGQWRRIIGSSPKAATPKCKKLFKRGFFRQTGQKAALLCHFFSQTAIKAGDPWSKIRVTMSVRIRSHAI